MSGTGVNLGIAKISESNSDYTVISIPPNYPAGTQVDFQVRALIGYITVTNYGIFGFTDWFEFHGETGDWSNTQTITIPETASISSNPTSTPTVPKFPRTVPICRDDL